MSSESFAGLPHLICMKRITGIHHVTAIAGDPQRNLDFYGGILGLRLVTLTVNFDDPGTYHLYYGNYSGDPGTILTFFPWRGIPKGRVGAGQISTTSFSVPKGGLQYWLGRLAEHAIPVRGPERRFAEEVLTFDDFDGMHVELVASDVIDPRAAWDGGPVPAEAAIRGLYSATLAVPRFAASERLLTGIMGFRKTGEEAGRHRYETADGGPHAIVDLIETPASQRGMQGAGSVHHIAWRVPSDAEQAEWRSELVSAGLGVSPVMDRNYFHSIYYREPSGILFEIATDPPGFAIDEPLADLGRRLVLPEWLEPRRTELEGVLPALTIPEAQYA